MPKFNPKNYREGIIRKSEFLSKNDSDLVSKIEIVNESFVCEFYNIDNNDVIIYQYKAETENEVFKWLKKMIKATKPKP
jgi:hypothetical protein